MTLTSANLHVQGMFFIERLYGPTLTEHEAHTLLSQFGGLSQCKALTALERAQMKVGEGCFAEFVMYDEGQAAQLVSPLLPPLFSIFYY